MEDLELIARKAGERLGMLRAFARTETEARTDPLTGLLNRRSLENRVRRLAEQGVPYVVAFADLDRFKELNTAYGHETGDRALRIFSRTLRDSIRPDDIPARWGGEEFVTLLPDCRIDDALMQAKASGRDVVVLATPHPESSKPNTSVVTFPTRHTEVATTAL